MKKQWLAFLMTIGLLAALVFLPEKFTLAHAELEGAVPAPGSTITQSPPQIRLVFSEGIELLGSSVSLLDASNAAVALDELQLDPADTDNRTLTVAVPAALSAGTYTVQWKNLSVDGHSEKGTYSFTLNLDAPTRVPTSVPTTAPTRAPTNAPTRAPTATRNSTPDVALRFAFKAGQTDVTCNKPITGLGAAKTTAQIMDARFYLSNIKLLTQDGKAVPLQLAVDNTWQSKDVALLDFENASGLCKATGTPDTRTIIVGKAPAGPYTGITFDVGVPAALNHADVVTAKAPLNVMALWTSRQNGYKFARIDLSLGVATSKTVPIQWGSTGCDKAAVKPCSKPNVMQVHLTNFNPAQDTIVADLSALLSEVNLAQSKPALAGCTAGASDSGCSRLFTNLGLMLATGHCLNDCQSQKFFRAEAAKS